VGRQCESLVDNVLFERHVHRVAFRIHDEFARNVTKSARGAGERDISKRLIDLDAAVDQGECHYALA
jgi:hypothetical protein